MSLLWTTCAEGTPDPDHCSRDKPPARAHGRAGRKAGALRRPYRSTPRLRRAGWTSTLAPLQASTARSGGYRPIVDYRVRQCSTLRVGGSAVSATLPSERELCVSLFNVFYGQIFFLVPLARSATSNCSAGLNLIYQSDRLVVPLEFTPSDPKYLGVAAAQMLPTACGMPKFGLVPCPKLIDR